MTCIRCPRSSTGPTFRIPTPPWLVALFSSAVCDSCRGLGAKLAPLESADVAVCEIAAEDRGDLHRRYELAAIPMTVVADADGVVRRAFVGAFTATDLWAAVADQRAPRPRATAPPNPTWVRLVADQRRRRRIIAPASATARLLDVVAE